MHLPKLRPQYPCVRQVQVICVLRHEWPVLGAVFSPVDDTLLAVAGASTVCWCVRSSTELYTLGRFCKTGPGPHNCSHKGLVTLDQVWRLVLGKEPGGAGEACGAACGCSGAA